MKLKCAMFSIDTYRIAAIEQLKTYANIFVCANGGCVYSGGDGAECRKV